jgi:hypothetical protein
VSQTLRHRLRSVADYCSAFAPELAAIWVLLLTLGVGLAVLSDLGGCSAPQSHTQIVGGTAQIGTTETRTKLKVGPATPSPAPPAPATEAQTPPAAPSTIRIRLVVPMAPQPVPAPQPSPAGPAGPSSGARL